MVSDGGDNVVLTEKTGTFGYIVVVGIMLGSFGALLLGIGILMADKDPGEALSIVLVGVFI